MVKDIADTRRMPVIPTLSVGSCGECPMASADDGGKDFCNHPSTTGGIRIRGSMTVRQAFCPLTLTAITISAAPMAPAALAEALEVPTAIAA